MAKYKEQWKSPIDPEVTGHVDTETGRFIQINSNNPFQEDFNGWVAAGGIPDPAYTAEEIAAYQAAHDKETDLQTERDSYAIPAMTAAERYAWIEEELEIITDTSTPTEIIDAVNDVIKALIVYI